MATKLALLCGLLCALAGSQFSLEAHAESRPGYGHTVMGSLLEEPLVVDPIAARTQTDRTVIAMLFDTLYRESEGKAVPHLASGLPDYSDPLAVRIPLRRGVVFHDGQPLRATDIRASLLRWQQSELSYMLAKVRSIEIRAGALVFHLSAPEPRLALRLASVHGSITPKGRAPTWRKPVGSGPYRLQSHSSERKELRVQANLKHFAGVPYAKELRLQWQEDRDSEARNYETGMSQISMRGDIAFAGHRPKYRSVKADAPAVLLAYVGFNPRSSLGANVKFRQAISAAIGRRGMQQISSGEQVVPSMSPLPRSARGTVISSAGLKADRGRVSKLLSELSVEHPKIKDRSLTLEMIVNKSRPDDIAIAGRVAAALYRVGLGTRLVRLPAGVFSRRVRAGECELYIGQLATGGGLPADTLRMAFVVGGFSRYLSSSLATASTAEMERRFNAHLPLVPLFHRGVRVHYRSDLHGLGFGDNNRIGYEDSYLFGLPEKN